MTDTKITPIQKPTECEFCGEQHTRLQCSRLSAVHFGPDGKTVEGVEFFPPEVAYPERFAHLDTEEDIGKIDGKE